MRMLTLLITALCAAAWSATPARGQTAGPQPNIGYAYPAGGQQGEVVRVLIGGQRLRGMETVLISGEGATATVVKHYRPLRNLSGDQRREIRRQWMLAAAARWGEDMSAANGARRGSPFRLGEKAAAAPDPPVELPDHPLLDGLAEMSLRELLHVRAVVMDASGRQPNQQIAESVLLEVTLDADAEPGDRELRLAGKAGLTNPVVFQVGGLVETKEYEPNDPGAASPLPAEPPLQLPVLINGQVLPGDVDRFTFEARKGQRLVLQVSARRLVPFLADAVPGWFQATLAVYDADGQEVAYADDFRFDPDPVLRMQAPGDGVYTVEVRDAIYRGREDFVYRLAIGELPFVTQVFPLGGSTERDTPATIDGWNLPGDRVLLSTRGGRGVGAVAIRRGLQVSNPIRFAAGDLPEKVEREDNDVLAAAQPVELPLVINGRISEAGDVDGFAFEAHAGQTIVAEVTARRLGSPLDGLLRLFGPDGQVVAWNDDDVGKEGFLFTNAGDQTHQADPYLMATLPTSGRYVVQLSDARSLGGEAAAYRLRISEPRPEFAAFVSPSSIVVTPGQSTVVTVHVLRRDGFEGPVHLAVREPEGFALHGGTVPAGCDSVRMTLAAPPKRLEAPVELAIEATAEAAGQTLVRKATPADDVMQAFLYRHLVPRERTLAMVTGWSRMPGRVEPADGVLRLRPGQDAVLTLNATGPAPQHAIEARLVDPPTGVSLKHVELLGSDLRLTFAVDGEETEAGAGNLIVEAWTMAPRKGKGAEAGPLQRVELGVLPAIPYEVVRP